MINNTTEHSIRGAIFSGTNVKEIKLAIENKFAQYKDLFQVSLKTNRPHKTFNGKSKNAAMNDIAMFSLPKTGSLVVDNPR
ncbi:MAG: hypothetical protein WCW87_01515 [Candidatus Paceibacterota bacterium]